MFRRQKKFIICLPKRGQTKLIESAQKSNNCSDVKTDLIVTKDKDDYVGYWLGEVSYYILNIQKKLDLFL